MVTLLDYIAYSYKNIPGTHFHVVLLFRDTAIRKFDWWQTVHSLGLWPTSRWAEWLPRVRCGNNSFLGVSQSCFLQLSGLGHPTHAQSPPQFPMNAKEHTASSSSGMLQLLVGIPSAVEPCHLVPLCYTADAWPLSPDESLFKNGSSVWLFWLMETRSPCFQVFFWLNKMF